MENALQDIADVFSIFHDGEIAAWKGNEQLLTLTMDYPYLAEMINPDFEIFYIELYDIEKLDLLTWSNPSDSPQLILKDYKKVFQLPLEIGYADIENDSITVSCYQRDSKYDYYGGNLHLACKQIKIYDHEKNELTVDELNEFCKKYWAKVKEETIKRMEKDGW